jgi:hypothetical protein
MIIHEQITKQKQALARCEKALAVEKLKKRKAETRHKIQLGGLIVKVGLDGFNKAVILGALAHAGELIESDPDYLQLFEAKGELLFLDHSL